MGEHPLRSKGKGGWGEELLEGGLGRRATFGMQINTTIFFKRDGNICLKRILGRTLD